MSLSTLHRTDRAGFLSEAVPGAVVAVIRQEPLPGIPPIEAFKRLRGADEAILLEGLGPCAPTRACIARRPLASLRAVGQTVTIAEGDRLSALVGDPIAETEAFLTARRPADLTALPRFAGAMGFFAYDVVRHIERLPSIAQDERVLPDAYWMIPGELVVYEPDLRLLTLVRLVQVEEGVDADSLYASAIADLDDLRAAMEAPEPARSIVPAAGPLAVRPGMEPEVFEAQVESLKEHIRAGDIFQVVLSHRFEAQSPAEPIAVYEELRRLNPSPYMYVLQLPEGTVLGASPELLYRLEDRTLTVRPIAGTRPRGQDADEDAALETGLRADAKELAEHVMLVDLGRNDVGRVAEIGTVRVADSLVLERYSHVMHLVSSVQGRLRPEASPFDAFRATFPAGTLSGAPKVRAMELIEAHEPLRRGLYGGALGYFGFGGDSELAIAIRTLVSSGGRYVFQAGAGIVYDSDPAREYEETLHKGRAPRQALERAHAALAKGE